MSATRLFLSVCASIFVGETLVMLLIAQLPPLAPWTRILLDATLLVVALFPILFVLVLRPTATQQAQHEQLEEARREYEAELRATLDSTADGILAVDDAGRILHSNRRFAELWRIPPSLIDQRSNEALLQFVLDQLADPGAFLAKVRSMFRSDEREMVTFAFKDGREFERFSVPMLMDGIRVGRVLSFRDITERKEAELALRDAAQKFRSLFDNAEVGMFRTRIDGSSILDMNDRFLRIFGRTREEVKDAPSVMHWVDPRERAEMMRRLEADGCVTDFECRMLHKSGEVRRCVTSLRLYPAEGTLEGSIADITDRTMATEALLHNQAILQSVTDGTTDAVYVKDANGRYLMCNDATCRFVGKSRQEILGNDDTTLFPSEEARVVMVGDRHIMDSGVTQTYEERVTTGSGVITFLSTKGPVSDAHGRVIGLFGVARDITARRRAEDELNRFFDLVPDMVAIASRDGVFKRVNRAWEDVLGFTREELLSVPIIELIHPDDRAAALAAVATRSAEGAIPAITSRGRCKDGSYRWLEWRATPAADGSLLFAAVRDVTERRLAEEARERLEGQLRHAQKMESVGRLAGGIAHDFNNMLAVILGHSEITMRQMDAAQPMHNSLVEIHSAAKRSADLTRQLLAFARKQTVMPKVMDLNAEVTHSLKMLKRLIREDIALTWQPAPTVWAVSMDPSQLDQALANLCVNASDAIAGIGAGNASRHSTSGEVTITTANQTLDAAFCAAHADAVRGDYVRLAVSDTGCGMTADVIAHLFEPFFTTKPTGEGTGLGLATVYGAIRQNNGFLAVSSVPGEGSTVEIYLPRHVVATVKGSPADASAPTARGTETVLVVEDEPSVLALTKLTLEDLGYTVLNASGSRDALRLSEAHDGKIHLLLTDVIMPEMSGMELAATLMAARPDIRYLFMSGYTAEVVSAQGIPMDGAHFIAKPFVLTTLAERVRAILDEVEPAEPHVTA
jgi:PAS domain S-box-containing protein